MLNLILRRILVGIPTLFIITTLCFFIMRLAPGNPFSSDKALPAEVLANIQAKYHMNDPLYKQYFDYLKQLAHGDLGPSFKYQDYTVNELLARSLPVSLKVGGITLIFSVIISVAIGLFAALNHNTKKDFLAMGFAMSGVVVPSFVLAPLAVLFFSIYLKWLPAGGWEGGDFKHLLLPVSVLIITGLAGTARLTRGTLLEIINSQYIRTAKAKGLPTRAILFKHALKPALLPMVTSIIPGAFLIVGGTLVIEQLFVFPGTGQLLVIATQNRDYSIILSLTILTSALFIVANIVVDIVYGFLDPKLRA